MTENLGAATGSGVSAAAAHEASITSGPDRVAQLSTALTALTERIDAACAAAGRDSSSVRLLPVTKFHPASDIEILYGLGLREFGESREQEASDKVAQLRHLSHVRWEFIGRLQRNKAKAVARWADTVYSVDSDRLVSALESGVRAALDAGERSAPLRVLLQVSLDADPARGGVSDTAMLDLADQLEKSANLQLAGLMAIPPLDADPDAAFERLARMHGSLLAEHPQASELSAGMSSDLEAAIRHGSTCVRVGTALMGARPITSA
ncbi:YggS family pyridoxal phosphate-dependent enzyme [Nocardia sp. NBC_01503]|uniref:YggS family pyridoxal phosphate-dependent enzyme n=1 Tax=Nocardia sp. NBC_01503 TaxID=2975997 RepID=UPI002E7BBCBC|nr:YggS family pyridoxal phosphate-dependent enzyme [Nocardia sp. NBC_01503]WTL32515.1 YggS family pyridoxal phosphate-dependent enzyme [Nocardia sp. NBC_01503]